MSEWPHQFTKSGFPKKVGERILLNGMIVPIENQEMICVHCYKRFIQGAEQKPSGPCPARHDKREEKRLKS